VFTYSLLVLSAEPSQTRHLVSTCREGGLVNSLIRQLPGCLNLSVLVSNQTESEVLVIVFFISLEAAVKATTSPMGLFLFGLLERMSKLSRNLGLYTFPVVTEPAQGERSSQLTSIHRQAAVVGWGWSLFVCQASGAWSIHLTKGRERRTTCAGPNGV